MSEEHGFRRLVSVAKIGDSGLAQTIKAAAGDLPQIAAYLEISAVKSLTAEISLNRWQGKGVRLVGTLTADVVQNCVVTLEPIEAHVEAEFERHYLPRDKLQADVENEQGVFVDPTADDPPEPLGHEIDIGEIMVEELSLNLDPYPRKPGAEFHTDDSPTRENPFAVLAKLKPKK